MKGALIVSLLLLTLLSGIFIGTLASPGRTATTTLVLTATETQLRTNTVRLVETTVLTRLTTLTSVIRTTETQPLTFTSTLRVTETQTQRTTDYRSVTSTVTQVFTEHGTATTTVRTTETRTTTQYRTTTVTVTTTESGALQAPSNLRVTGVDYNRISLAWQDNSANEEGFIVERSEDGRTFSAIGRTGQNAASYTDGTVRGERTYYYRVRAFRGNSVSRPSNTVMETATPSRALHHQLLRRARRARDGLRELGGWGFRASIADLFWVAWN
ncbi:MAG: fibronectin type III domain-containing protein [Candidatus Caldarchaeales archaeon]